MSEFNQPLRFGMLEKGRLTVTWSLINIHDSIRFNVVKKDLRSEAIVLEMKKLIQVKNLTFANIVKKGILKLENVLT